jgi:hypothetical protein
MSLMLRISWSDLKKRQGKGQDNIQSNHQDENNNYAEDDIISIRGDDEMINEERGLVVSDMKTVIQTDDNNLKDGPNT